MLYLDSADRAEWAALLPSGIFHGITTNPLLAERAGLDYNAIDWSEMAAEAAHLGARELHVQVSGPPSGYAEQAADFRMAAAKIDIEIVIKVPLTEAALLAVPEILASGSRVLMTACYDAKQMFLAKALGAAFIAPYYGRMVEAGIDADLHMRQMLQIAEGGGCEILVASLRSAEQMRHLGEMGLRTFTIAPGVARDLLQDPLTDAAVLAFEVAAGNG